MLPKYGVKKKKKKRRIHFMLVQHVNSYDSTVHIKTTG